MKKSTLLFSVPGLDKLSNFKSYSLGDLLGCRSLAMPNNRAYTFLLDEEPGELHLSYRELDRQARSIAAMLQNFGLQGQRALLLYPPGLEYIAGFFGCLYAGVIAVPVFPPRLNSTLPRIQAIIANAQPVAALTTNAIRSTTETLFAQAPQLKALQWVVTDNISGDIGDDWRMPVLTGGSIALLQYTSGSTGTPRGVMVSHENLLYNSALIYQMCEHDSNSRFVSWLPIYHDMGLIAGVLQPLYGGVTGILMSPAVFLRRPLRWLKAISRYKATTSGGPNFAYDLCVHKIRPEERTTLDLSSWDVAFNGSEPIRPETLNRFAAAFEPCGFRREAFYPCYGLAEATLIVSGGAKKKPPVVTSFQATSLVNNEVVKPSEGATGARTLVGCGHVLQGEKIVIADPDLLTKCPPKRVGEIWVSSPSVTGGYWNRPQETEQTFHARLLDTNEGPFLRTGDLGLLQDGELFITGRLKDLIIIRGSNHYPQDIELTVERSHHSLRPGCGAAFSVEDDREELLVVVQEIDYRQKPDVNSVFDAIRRTVAESHEIQVYSIVLIKPGTIPKTSSGKIQRYACREGFLNETLDEVARDTLDRSFEMSGNQGFIQMALLAVAPAERQSLLETYLLEQVGNVLKIGRSRVKPQQSMSTLGLDSLMALELKNKIENELRVTVSKTEFLQSMSIAQLARKLLDGLQTSSSIPSLAIEPTRQTISEYPLSYIQRALYFRHSFTPESPAYNVVFAAQICSEVDTKVLRCAFQQIINRHACLRATYSVRDGQPYQTIPPYSEVCFEEIEMPSCERVELETCLSERAHRPFDLEQGPIFRVCLFRVSEKEIFLLLATHHIAIDGWSFWLLLDELRILYARGKEGIQIPLPELAFQYTDFVTWQTNMLKSREGERLWEYWQRELAGYLPRLNLPTFRPRPQGETSRGSSFVFTLEKDLTRRLKILAQTEEATFYMVMLAAFQALLHRYTGQDDILVGSPISGRSRAEFKEVVGCFFNIVPMRANLSGVPAFKSFLQATRSAVLRALDHQDYPSHLLAERLRTDHVASRSPLFQVTLTLQKPHRLQEDFSRIVSDEHAKVDLGGLVLKFFPLERKYARTDLELELIEANGSVSALLQYNADLFDADWVARLAGQYETLLKSIVANPEGRVSELPILTGEEKQYLLSGFASARKYYSQYSLVHQFFEEQAERNGDKVAAVYSDHSLTFHELDEKSERLANLIRKVSG